MVNAIFSNAFTIPLYIVSIIVFSFLLISSVVYFLGSVDAIYQKKTTRASDPNIYDSILLCDDNGYRIPLQDSIDGDSRIESPCRGSLDPYYVTTLTKLSTSREGEKIGKSDQMNEVKATNTEYQKMSKPRNDNVDSDEAAYYLQVICDSEDNQGGESESSSRQPSAISPTPVYTSLILWSHTEDEKFDRETVYNEGGNQRVIHCVKGFLF